MRFFQTAILAFAMFSCAILSAQVKKEAIKEIPKEAPKAPPKGTSKEAPKKDAPKEPPAETPVDQGKIDRETLQQAGYQADGKALLGFFESHTVTDADRLRIAQLIKQLGDVDFDIRETATAELVKFGVAAIGLLRQADTTSSDQEVSLRCDRVLRTIEKVPTRTLAVAAARVLADLKPENTAQILMNYLPLADDESVTDEIRNTLAAVAMKNGKENPFLKETLKHAEILKRGAAAEALARAGSSEVREEMHKYFEKEATPEIRFRIALALVTSAKDKKMVVPLIKLLAEVPQELGWRAEDVLCRLAGENTPNVSVGRDVASREKARDEWLKWFDKHGEKADLAKLDEVERLLGFTLLAEWNIQGQPGRVAELGPDGKVRWEIKNLQFPTDLVVLPNNRVVIAEQNNNRVSERDTTNGKEIWGVQLNQPVSLQRWNNGNLVVCCRHEIFEWDRDRKKVSSITRNQFDIVAGTKLRNGQFLIVTNQGEVIRYGKDNKVEKSFRIGGRMNYYASVQALPNNKILLTEQRGIREYDLESGKDTGWSYNGLAFPTAAFRLPNGNTIVSSQNSNKAVEVDRNGKEVWSYASNDAFARPWRVKRR
jgi:HEAT repeat protein